LLDGGETVNSQIQEPTSHCLGVAKEIENRNKDKPKIQKITPKFSGKSLPLNHNAQF